MQFFRYCLVGILGSYTALTRSVKAGREKVTLASLAANYLEVVRNLPYSQIGTTNGNPSGALPDQTNAVSKTIESRTYQIYYEVTNVHDPADPVAGNPTYKQVKMFIRNSGTGQITNFVTTVSPRNAVTNPNTGALQVQVIDANGEPVPDAQVHIENTALTPDVLLDRTSDAAGLWTEIGLTASVNGYHIVATKVGLLD